MIPKGRLLPLSQHRQRKLVVIRVGAGVKGQKQGGEEMRVRPTANRLSLPPRKQDRATRRRHAIFLPTRRGRRRAIN